MIHHFARALAVREQVRAQASAAQRTPSAAAAPSAPAATAQLMPLVGHLRIRRDPADGRRTMIAGRFADVCAALDRMVVELEAAA